MPTIEALAAFNEAQAMAAKLRELDRQEGQLLAGLEAVANETEAQQLFDAVQAVRKEWATVFNQHAAAMGRYANEARRG